MRSIKELLELMMDTQGIYLHGLCYWVDRLYMSVIINSQERTILIKYIENNRPSKWSSLSAFKNRNKAYYWKRNSIKPRIKWIKKHIKLNS